MSMAEKGGNPQPSLAPGNAAPPPYVPIDPPPAYTQAPYPGEGYQTNFSGAPIPGQVQPQIVTVMKISQWGPFPMQIVCPQCQARIMTETNASPGLLTWLLSGALVFIGCWLGCCLIPCCIPECQDIEHSCPNCKAHLGTFRRI